LRKVLALTALAILLTPAAHAQSTSPSSRLWLWQTVAGAALRPPYAWTLKQVEAEMRQHFLANSSDGQRVTRADHELAEKMARAEARAQALQQWLRFDICLQPTGDQRELDPGRRDDRGGPEPFDRRYRLAGQGDSRGRPRDRAR
jgi:hypothetical protein